MVREQCSAAIEGWQTSITVYIAYLCILFNYLNASHYADQPAVYQNLSANVFLTWMTSDHLSYGLHVSSPLWHQWNDSPVKETELHSLTGPTPQESKCGSELWKQWTEFKPSHVFLRSVSGNGNGSKIKGEKRRGGWWNPDTAPPTPLPRMQWLHVVLFFFFMGGVCLSSKTRGRLSYQEKGKRRGRLKNFWASCQQGGVPSKLDPCSTNTVPYKPLSGKRGKKAEWLRPCVAPVTCASVAY